MSASTRFRRLTIMLIAVGALCCVPLTAALAQSATWIDEISNSLSFYKASYPHSNWDPYIQKLTVVKDALGRGDQRMVRVEMGKWFKMLRNRDYGIHDVAADELYNFAVMVTPLQEYGISVPLSAAGQ
ncbi:MAG: hypothetical protein C4293_07110 [Nitrospiraceae bacterium]